MHPRKSIATVATIAALVIFFTCRAAGAQALSVLPVNIFLQPGQKATTLTVTNQGDHETSVQIRAFAWSQQSGDDQLTASDAVVVSPPIATIAPGATQVVRLILRVPPSSGDREATYRILVDQIPPPAEPGVVRVVLRLSIPIFALPATRAVSNVRYRLAFDAGKMFLVGSNDGLRHESIRDIVLLTSDGRKLKPTAGTSPYILSGATRRWPIDVEGPLPLPSEPIQLTGHSDTGAIDEQVGVVAAP
jgi:fimbrial chaperone protein